MMVLAAAMPLCMAQFTPSATQPTDDPLAGFGRPDDRKEPLPPELEGVGIAERLNQLLPLDAEFTTHDRRSVPLRTFFDGRRPVVLVLNYYRCPMLCGLLLNGLLDALQELDWTAGEQFQIVTVSFNPREGPELANLKRQNYLKQYGRPAAEAGWHFLVGRQENIQRLLDATGFSVKRDEATGEYAHASTLILCTPDGRIARYLRGVVFEPRTLRLSLVEAAEGKIGTTMDQLLLFCYHYRDGQYTLATMNIARGAGLITLAIVAAILITLWRRETHRRQTRVSSGEAAR
jgi:protein SCO1/2